MMRESDDGVAQVIEFTASISILMIVFTVFFTAVGFQAGQFIDRQPQPTGKALDAASYLMSTPGYVEGPNTTSWESGNLLLEDLQGLTAFGLSTGEFGVLDHDKIVRLGELDWGNLSHTFLYDIIRNLLGLSYYHPNTGYLTSAYDINISVRYTNGTSLMKWGYPAPVDPADEDYSNLFLGGHTIVTRVVLIEQDGIRTPGYLEIDLIVG